MLYERNDIAFARGKFRVRGDVVEVYPAYLEDEAIRVEFFGDEIDRITVRSADRERHRRSTATPSIPAKQFVTPADKMQRAIERFATS